MTPKLTAPQQQLLDSIREEPRKVVESYKPAQALVRLGLATWDRFGELCLVIKEDSK